MTTTSTAPTVDEMVAQVEPTLRQYTAQAEADRRLAPEAIEALHDAGVFRSMLPKAYGGLEMDPVCALRLFEAIACIDGAAGWIAANQSGISTLPMLFPAACGDELFAQPRTLLAGGWFPPGKAEPVQGGYRVSGQWAFAAAATTRPGSPGRRSSSTTGRPSSVRTAIRPR
ncbi:MAG TPA: acyl-CoA dehydrogenase family protein [Dehalococcoidia bacterium]|nr:acyl-CoA dehydrogenase family protein [Dehalococcoidia bacterium]